MNFWTISFWILYLFTWDIGQSYLLPSHVNLGYSHVSIGCEVNWNNQYMYNVGVLQYSSDVLHDIHKQQQRKARIPLQVLHMIRHLDICSESKTHRGSKAGKNTRYKIQVKVTEKRRFVSRAGIVNSENLVCVPIVRWNLPTLMNTNITGGLSGKRPEISVVSNNFHCDIVCVTESWCTKNVPDKAINIDEFEPYRRDRQDGRSHGGIVCYIKPHSPGAQRDLINRLSAKGLMVDSDSKFCLVFRNVSLKCVNPCNFSQYAITYTKVVENN